MIEIPIRSIDIKNAIVQLIVISVLNFSMIPVAHAQDCHCDHHVSLSTKTVDNNSLNLPAGSVICIEAGVRDHLIFKNFRSEDSNARFVFKNCGGQVVIHSTYNASGIAFRNCKNYQLTGTGETGVEYGFHIQGRSKADGSGYIPAWGLLCGELSTDFEIDHVKISRINFAGFGLKTDPDCVDSSAWRGNFTMRNISVHHNRVDSTATGEGFYIGYSFYGGRKNCPKAKPHHIESLRVFDNIVTHTGADGIQVGCAVRDCEIYDNHIEDYGLSPFNGNVFEQGNGIQLGDGTTGLCYNNYIKAKSGVITGGGIKVFGINNVVFNNILVNPHELGIFLDERSGSDRGPGSGYRIYNNTIINPNGNGIWLQTDEVENNWVKNNIIIKSGGTGTFIFAEDSVNIDSAHNFLNHDISSAKFVGEAEGNYRLSNTSPCLKKGINLFSEGIKCDFDHHPRPPAGNFSQGAFEMPATKEEK